MRTRFRKRRGERRSSVLAAYETVRLRVRCHCLKSLAKSVFTCRGDAGPPRPPNGQSPADCSRWRTGALSNPQAILAFWHLWELKLKVLSRKRLPWRTVANVSRRCRGRSWRAIAYETGLAISRESIPGRVDADGIGGDSQSPTRRRGPVNKLLRARRAYRPHYSSTTWQFDDFKIRAVCPQARSSSSRERQRRQPGNFR